MKKNNVKTMLALVLALSLFLGLAVPVFAAGTTTYTFNISDIPQSQWDAARKEILIHVEQDGVTRDITIPANAAGMGHATLTGLPIYENGVKMDKQPTMSITLVPTRLLSEALGIPITWNQEAQAVEFDTYQGHISIPVGATSITLPDGSIWQETTYTYPDGSPIQLALTRAQESRTYLPIRAFSSIAFEESTWDWSSPARLEGWVKLPKTTVGKEGWTEEQKMGLKAVWESGITAHLEDLPNTSKAMEETGWEPRTYNETFLIEHPDQAGSVGIIVGYSDGSIQLRNLHSVIGCNWDGKSEYIKLVRAVLLDILPDEADANAIADKFNVLESLYPAYLNSEDGSAEEAAAIKAINAAEDEITGEYNSVSVKYQGGLLRDVHLGKSLIITLK